MTEAVPTLPIRFCVSGSKDSSPTSSVARPDSLDPDKVSKSSRLLSLVQADHCALFAIQSPISHNRLEVTSESLIDTDAPSVFAMSATTPTELSNPSLVGVGSIAGYTKCTFSVRAAQRRLGGERQRTVV
jgi:hypothetical protein